MTFSEASSFSIANSKHFKLFHSCQHANCTLYPVPFFKNTPPNKTQLHRGCMEVNGGDLLLLAHAAFFFSFSNLQFRTFKKLLCTWIQILKALWPACCLQCELLWRQQLLQAPPAPNDIHKHTHRHPWLLLKSLLFLLICFLMWCFKRLKN